jgi:hypothetical protein
MNRRETLGALGVGAASLTALSSMKADGLRAITPMSTASPTGTA